MWWVETEFGDNKLTLGKVQNNIPSLCSNNMNISAYVMSRFIQMSSYRLSKP